MRALVRALEATPSVRIRSARCCNPHCAALTLRRAFSAAIGHQQAIANTGADSSNIISTVKFYEPVSLTVSPARFVRFARLTRSPTELWQLINIHYDPQQRLNMSELQTALKALRNFIGEQRFSADAYVHDSHSALYRSLVALLPLMSVKQLVSVTGALSAVYDGFAVNRIRLHGTIRQSLDSAVAALIARWSTELLPEVKTESHSITGLFLSIAHFASSHRENQHYWLLRQSLMEMIEGAVPTLSIKALCSVLDSLLHISSFDTSTDADTMQQHQQLSHQLIVTIMKKVLSEPTVLDYSTSKQLVTLAQSVARFSLLSQHYRDDVVSRLCDRMDTIFDTVRLVDAHRFAMALMEMRYDSPRIYRLVIGKWLAAPLAAWSQDTKVVNLLTGLMSLYPWQNDMVMKNLVNMFQANVPSSKMSTLSLGQKIHLLWAMLAYVRANPGELSSRSVIIESVCQSLNSDTRWSASRSPNSLTFLYHCLLLAPSPLPLHPDLVSQAMAMWRWTRECEQVQIHRGRDYQEFLHYYQQNLVDQWNLELSFADSDTRLAPFNTVGARRDGSGFLLWPYPRSNCLHIHESRITLSHRNRLQLQLAREGGKELYVIKKTLVRGQLEWRLVAVREGECEAVLANDARAGA